MREKILNMLEKNSRIDLKDMAVMLGMTEVEVANEIADMEKEHVICGYNTLINWDKTSEEKVTALIEVKVTPQRGLGFDSIAERIYKYDGMTDGFKYCYWITPAKFRSGLFDSSFFSDPVDIPFEDTKLLGSEKVKEYLEYRYGDYMKLPSAEAQKASVHAVKYDIHKNYTEYI